MTLLRDIDGYLSIDDISIEMRKFKRWLGNNFQKDLYKSNVPRFYFHLINHMQYIHRLEQYTDCIVSRRLANNMLVDGWCTNVSYIIINIIYLISSPN